MSFFDILFLITSFVSFDHCIECPETVDQRRTYNKMVKRYKRGNKKEYIKEGHTIQWSKDTKAFDHCIECPSLMYCFLLPLLYLLTIVLNVLL
jgi:hypothetical protein